MTILFIISIAFVIWYFTGCIIMVIIDKNGELLDWSKKAPYGLDWLVPTFFPVILYFYFKNKK